MSLTHSPPRQLPSSNGYLPQAVRHVQHRHRLDGESPRAVETAARLCPCPLIPESSRPRPEGGKWPRSGRA